MTFAEDYVEVAPRIVEWYARHPDGRIETSVIEWTGERVTVRAEVFRSLDPDEPPAGTGHSYMTLPGTTPFTKGSELENAETSAVGRALVMAGIPAKNVASADEVAAKRTAGAGQGMQGGPGGRPAPASPSEGTTGAHPQGHGERPPSADAPGASEPGPSDLQSAPRGVADQVQPPDPEGGDVNGEGATSPEGSGAAPCRYCGSGEFKRRGERTEVCGACGKVRRISEGASA